MALSIFADALPYSEMQKNYNDWFPGMQLSELIPNIAYSSSLHWQLYCDKYPDDRKVLVDWTPGCEKNKYVRLISTVFQPLDRFETGTIIFKKILDRYIFRRNLFANIPLKFRKEFTEKGKYLFWDKNTYEAEDIFKGFVVVSQDEGHKTFDKTLEEFYKALEGDNPNIFFNTGFADMIGHLVRRGDLYSERLAPNMEKLHNAISAYLQKYPNEEVVLISDHGMSTIYNCVDLNFEKLFGRQSKSSYIVYRDSCLMCVWIYKDELKEPISKFLQEQETGHLLTEEERKYYRTTDRLFGDYIFILREGNVFANSWFGKSLRKPGSDGSGMHGFWPERAAKDQMASVVLINSEKILEPYLTYPKVNQLLNAIMQP